jgi:hypothetical protein
MNVSDVTELYVYFTILYVKWHIFAVMNQEWN